MLDAFSDKLIEKKAIMQFQIVLSMISRLRPATILKTESNTGVFL